MTPIFVIVCLALVIGQFTLPRRYAFVPLLVAVCHCQNVAVITLGAGFTICKLVILAGLIRASQDRTFVWSWSQPMDRWFAVWAVWILLSGFFHAPKDHNPLTVRLSAIYDFFGGYLYARSYFKDPEDFFRYARCLAVVMLPLALEVMLEQTIHRNFYGMISGGEQQVGIRAGRVRAFGPFGHAILLGSFAATSLLLLAPLWHRERRWMIIGSVACVVAVFCSASSGPIMTLGSGMLILGLWPWRARVGAIRKLVIAAIVFLHLVMQAPVWYLMAKIDLAGGSTGWHRAELISAALNHLGEWWLIGTEYTRHWIAYGVPWSENHIDMTNHYLLLGVTGGLPLLIFFTLILAQAFRSLGKALQWMRDRNNPNEFLIWCVGAALFAHALTFVSVSYFDQNVVAVAVLLGAVPGLCAAEIGG